MKRNREASGVEHRFTPMERWATAERGKTWIRAQEESAATIQGYSSVFDTWYSIRDFFGEYQERVDSKAFDKTLREGGDAVIGLFNHNIDYPLGSISAGTMRQGTDKTGLWYEIDAALDSPQSKSVVVAIERGDVKGSSITFQIIRDIWEDEHDEDGSLVAERRTIMEAKLFEHGPVTLPASPTTSAELKTQATDEEINSVAIKIRRGYPLTQWDLRVYNTNTDLYRQIVDGSEPSRVKHSEPEPLPSPHQKPSTHEDMRRFESHFMGRFQQQSREVGRWRS